MKLIPVALALFQRWNAEERILEVWTQVRTDDGIYHGLLEFPGGGIEPGETPLEAVIREVKEEVGIVVDPKEAKFMGTYPNEGSNRTVLLYVFLFPDRPELADKGKWLVVVDDSLSSVHQGQIPLPNHRIIDDLFRSLA